MLDGANGSGLGPVYKVAHSWLTYAPPCPIIGP